MISHGWFRYVGALGITQVLGYGSLYYAFPILVPAIAADFGIAEATLYAIFSVGLLVSGGVAGVAGPQLDRFGAPRVMAAGSLLTALLLCALAFAPNVLILGAVIIVIEAVSFLVLYDAAFAALALGVPQGTRRAITRLTLIAGFASTVFWPLTGWLEAELGWRMTYLLFAGLHLGIALPLHLWLSQLARVAAIRADGAPAEVAAPDWPVLSPDSRRRGFWALGVAFALLAIVIAALGVHMVPVLIAMGLGTQAYLVGMAMGPAQVVIRVIDATVLRNLHPLDVAIISAAALALALVALFFAPASIALALAFAVLFGAGQGLTSIVRGAVPLALFGAQGFGRRLGHLAMLRSLFAAAAPFAFALLQAQLGLSLTLGVALGVTLGGLGLLFWLRALVARDRAR